MAMEAVGTMQLAHRYADAAELLDRLIRKYPDNDDFKILRASTYLNGYGDMPAARTLIEQSANARCSRHAIRYHHGQNHLQKSGCIDIAPAKRRSMVDGNQYRPDHESVLERSQYDRAPACNA